MVSKIIYDGFKGNSSPNKPTKKYYAYRTADSKLIEATINEYWINVIKDPDFDPAPFFPIKNSPLCEKYYLPNIYRNRCKLCPISRGGLGCYLEESFYIKYAQSAGEDRKNKAIICAKLFESIYNELVETEKIQS